MFLRKYHSTTISLSEVLPDTAQLTKFTSVNLNKPKLGDFVEFKSYVFFEHFVIMVRNNHVLTPGIILQSISDSNGSTYKVLTSSGITTQLENQFLFRYKNWLSKVSPQTSERNYTNIAFYEALPSTILDELSQIGQSPKSIMDNLFSFIDASDYYLKTQRQLLASVHEQCHALIAKEIGTDIRRNIFISMDTITRVAFYNEPLAIDKSKSTPSTVYLKTSNLDPNETSAGRLYATYTFLKSSGSCYFDAHITKVSEFQNTRLYRVVSREDLAKLEFINSELNAYRKRNGNSAGDAPGSSLESFLKKLAQMDKNPDVVLDFSERDAIFIHSAKETALKHQATFSPFVAYFYRIYRYLVKMGLAIPKNAPKVAAIEFLQRFRIISHWDFPNAEMTINEYDLDVFVSKNKMDWSSQLDTEIQSQANHIINQYNGKPKTNIELNHNVYSTLAKHNIGSSLNLSPESMQSWFKSHMNNDLKDPFENYRREFTETVFVIDSSTANELDDGISVEPIFDMHGNTTGHWLHVHIADPTSVLSHDHPISIIAQSKGSSIYLPDRHYSLLPYAFSENIFDLRNGCNALTFSARIGNDGDICDSQVTASVLKNVEKISYADVDSIASWKFIDTDNPNLGQWSKRQLELRASNASHSRRVEISEASINAINIIQEIANKHVRFRKLNGALVPDVAEYNVNVTSLDKNSNNFKQSPVVHFDPYCALHLSPSRLTVSESMVIAGRVAAKFCTDHNIPAPYRGQVSILDYTNIPSYSALIQNSDIEIDKVKITQDLHQTYENILQSRDVNGVVSYFEVQKLFPYMSSAIQDLRPIAHSSMGIPGLNALHENTPSPSSLSSTIHGYLKATSPLRRYSDMVVHWQIKAGLLKELKKDVHTAIPFSNEDIKQLIPKLSVIDKGIKRVSSTITNSWIVEWCRRREAHFEEFGSDPLMDSKSHMRTAMGIGLRAIRAPVVWPIRRSYEDMKSIHSPIYTAFVTRTDLRTVDREPGMSSLRDCMIMELGCKKVELFAASEKAALYKIGDAVKCRVLSADAFSNYLRMIVV